jgi:hypothetical protein
MFAHQIWVDTAADPSILKIRNADNDAWITIGTIDQTGDTFTLTSAVTTSNADINGGTIDGTAIGGASAAAGAFTTLNTSGAVVFNDAGADVDFRVEGDTDANLLFVDASADRVGIGASAPAVKVQVNSTDNYVAGLESSTTFALLGFKASDSTATTMADPNVAIGGTGDALYFRAGGTERARIDSSGNLLVGTIDTNPSGNNVAGFALTDAGNLLKVSADGSPALRINRKTSDGGLVLFNQDGAEEGSISVSGNTVSYNPFLGSHAGALDDWSRTDIKVGTVMDTINELLEYKVVVIDVQEDVPAKDAVLDEEGNEVEPAQEAITQTVQKRISYNGNGAVGSTATVEYEGQEYTGVIEHERKIPSTFNKHLKVKINDTAASKTVFGVFVGWNNDPNNDGGVYNDMLVGAVGNYVIRMAAGQTPEAGDLVEADGNGCAVVQDDDIIRTKTIAKVTSTIPQVTYDDGSFLVTCVLYCG